MEKIGKLRSMNDLKNWESITYNRITRSPTTYDETENYIKEKLKSLVSEYKSLVSPQEKRLCRDLIDASLRRFHQYSIKERLKAFYFESPQPETPDNLIFEHIIPASTLRDLLLTEKIDIPHALYPPVARISKINDKKINKKGLVSSNNDLLHPFKRYATSGIFASSKIVDCFDNEIIPQNYTLNDHYNYVNKLFEEIHHIQGDSSRLSPLNLLKQLKSR